MKFKRDRRIKNKLQLYSLQRKVEIALKEIDKLDKEPTSIGGIWAMVVGVIGTIFLVFAVMTMKSFYMLGILCGIVGMIGWLLPYFIYTKVKANKEQDNISLIEEQYDVIYNSCEQAKKLLN